VLVWNRKHAQAKPIVFSAAVSFRDNGCPEPVLIKSSRRFHQQQHNTIQMVVGFFLCGKFEPAALIESTATRSESSLLNLRTASCLLFAAISPAQAGPSHSFLCCCC
jgi:hypothetical protein